MPRKTVISVVVLLALLAVSFTSDTGKVAMSTSKSNPVVSAAPAQAIESLDDQFAAIARQVPGFGGLYFDQDGTMKVYMVAQKEPVTDNLISSLEDVITREIGGGERLTHSGVEVIEGQYSFLDLHSWNQELSPAVLSLPGVVFTDLDEKTNRLRIGVTDSKEILEAVENSLAGVNIPRDEVVIRQHKQTNLHLRNFRRPLRGGLQINFGNFLCTLGFPAVRNGVNGYVTNSHCTTTQGGVQNTVEHQPSASGTANRVGIEIADPTYFSGSGCPAGRVCRRSDSSFIRVPHPSGPAVTIDRGTIARPAVKSFNWNRVDIFNINIEGFDLVGIAVY